MGHFKEYLFAWKILLFNPVFNNWKKIDEKTVSKIVPTFWQKKWFEWSWLRKPFFFLKSLEKFIQTEKGPEHFWNRILFNLFLDGDSKYQSKKNDNYYWNKQLDWIFQKTIFLRYKNFYIYHFLTNMIFQFT